MVTITVHSFKGGTGKSLIAISLAFSCSKRGEKVLLIDGDYNAPCLKTYFPPDDKVRPFTSFLESKCKIKDVISATKHPNLYVSYAPAPNFSQEILQADVRTHGRYLKRIIEGLQLVHEDLGFDKVIIDNSSGISLQAINHLSCSDKSVIVIRPVRYGVESTYDLIQAIYQKLRYADPAAIRRDFIVWNQVPVSSESPLSPRIENYLKDWTDKFEEAGIAYGTTIPYIFDVVASMIAEETLDLPKITGLIDAYVEEIRVKLA